MEGWCGHFLDWLGLDRKNGAAQDFKPEWRLKFGTIIAACCIYLETELDFLLRGGEVNSQGVVDFKLQSKQQGSGIIIIEIK